MNAATPLADKHDQTTIGCNEYQESKLKLPESDIVERFGLRSIPPATFLMGDRSGEGFAQERPVHEVFVNGFYLGKYCVTVKDYHEFMIDMGNQIDDNWCDYINPTFVFKDGDAPMIWPGAERFPMVNVNAAGAIAYCNWCSEKSGLEAVYGPDAKGDLTKSGFRLPTEAEWEYACGGPRGYVYGYGDTFDPELVNYRDYHGQYARFRASTEHIGGYGLFEYAVMPVGLLPPNDFGLYDMLGNVYEWCNDRYLPYPEPGRKEARQDLETSFQVTRGGCFVDRQDRMRSSFRHAIHWQAKCFIQGFRMARNAAF